MPTRCIFVLIALCAGAVAQTAPDYSKHGPFAVIYRDVTLHDATRDKDQPLRVYFPDTTKPGPFPVIVFSHGAGASRENYQRWGEQWASYGYEVIHPTHSDSIKLRREQGEHVRPMDPLRTAMHDEHAWRERPQDISFVLDHLRDIEQVTAQRVGRIDDKRIGVGGHSFGAYTAQAIGGATTKLGSFRDPRVKAVIIMSPQGEGEMGLTAESFSGLKTPALIMTGGRDFDSRNQDSAWRKQPYSASPPGDKYLLWFQDANHFTFAGGSSSTQQSRPRLASRRQPAANSAQMHDCIAAVSTAFWETYLRDSKSAAAQLHAADPPGCTGAGATWSHR